MKGLFALFFVAILLFRLNLFLVTLPFFWYATCDKISMRKSYRIKAQFARRSGEMYSKKLSGGEQNQLAEIVGRP